MTTLIVDGTKVCTSCGQAKPIDDFYRRNKSADGRQARCKPCANTATVASRQKNPERQREYDRAHYQRHKHRWAMEYNLLRRYGITKEEWESLLETQGNKCAICRRGPEGFKNHARLFVDHDHATGRIRGLLCGTCNSGLGHFKDSPDLLRMAATYLEVA